MSKPRLFMPNRLERLVENHFKSSKVSRVFGQLYYWSNLMPDGFYKFKEPCKHPLYKESQSWSEDLNMTKRIFDPIFKRLVTHHKSKNEYRNSSDKFDGKFFCSYTERNTNKTFYFMNKEMVGQFIESLQAKISPSPAPAPKEVQTSYYQPKSMPVEASREEHFVVHSVCARLNTNTNTQTNTSLAKSVSGNIPTESENEKSKLVSKEMVSTWNSLLDDNVVLFSSHTAKLSNALDQSFGGCIEKFKEYCLAIASSPFLTGKAKSSFRAVLWWVIKPEIVLSIKQGAYGVAKSFWMPVSEEPEYQIRSADSLQEEILAYQEPKEIRDFRTLCLASVGNAKYISYFKKLKVEFKDDNVVLTAATKFEATSLESNCYFHLTQLLEKLGKAAFNILAPGDVRGSWIIREKPSVVKERAEMDTRIQRAVVGFKKFGDINQQVARNL